MASFTFLLLKFTILFCIASYTVSTADDDAATMDFSSDYQRMVSTFKVFPYALPPLKRSIKQPTNSTTTTALFHSMLLSSPFVTTNPIDAHLFYFPAPPDLPPRSLDRVISRARSSSPYWNRSLGADHFFLSSCSTAPPSSARNVVELRKNSIRLTDCFSSHFLPHKDLSLPPLLTERGPSGRHTETNSSDPEFMRLLTSKKFCLFPYGGVGFAGLGEALQCGCVPVVVTDGRPIRDMPLMDVIRWQEMAVFVGTGVGPVGMKRILKELAGREEGYERMKRLGAAAARYLTWNNPPKPYDAFHMVMYQLWLKRHAVRYAAWEMS